MPGEHSVVRLMKVGRKKRHDGYFSDARLGSHVKHMSKQKRQKQERNYDNDSERSYLMGFYTISAMMGMG